MSQGIDQAVVGLAVTNPDVIPEILSKINPSDLWDPKAEAVLTAVAGLWADGTYVDALGVTKRLSGSQVGAGDVFSMVQQACMPAALPGHLKTLMDTATRRRLSAAGQRIHQLAEQGESTTHIAQHAQELLDGAIRTDDAETRTLGETLPTAMARIQAAARGGTQTGLPTGFADLDDMLHGMAGGQMIIVAARPGYGKTTLAVDFMRHASVKLGVPSLMFSLEMGEEELTTRVLSAEASVPMGNLTSGQVTEQEQEKLNQTAQRLHDVPIHIDAGSSPTISDILAKARLYAEHKKVGLIVVDYLQLLRAEGVFSREQEIAGYSRAMKLLAKQTGVPVVVVAQLNRESTKRGGTPMLSDIRESGSLEQDADVVMLLDRPEAIDPGSARAGEMDVIVAKNRRGRTGTVTLAAQLHYSRFRNFAKIPG